jgi:hypothetical protein
MNRSLPTGSPTSSGSIPSRSLSAWTVLRTSQDR